MRAVPLAPGPAGPGWDGCEIITPSPSAPWGSAPGLFLLPHNFQSHLGLAVCHH